MDTEVKDAWVPPNDRQLALRAKLRSGWSVKTQSFQSFHKPESLSEAEQEKIRTVIKRAEQLEEIEQERVGKLVERLDNMRRQALGNGVNQCILCGERFSLLTSASQLRCQDCKKSVCSKCGIDTTCSRNLPIWLCKLCSEQREMWKKSGAWFFKSVPKYTVPERKTTNNGKYGRYAKSAPAVSYLANSDASGKVSSWAKKAVKSQTSSELDEGANSSDEEAALKVRISPVASIQSSRYSLNIIGKHGSLSPSPQGSFSETENPRLRSPSPYKTDGMATSENEADGTPSQNRSEAESERSKDEEDPDFLRRDALPRRTMRDLRKAQQPSILQGPTENLRISPNKPPDVSVVTVTSSNEEDMVIHVSSNGPISVDRDPKKNSILARSRALFSRRNSSIGKSQDSESNHSYSSTIAKSFESLASVGSDKKQNGSRAGSLSTNSSLSQSSLEKSPAPSTKSLNVSSCPSSRANSSEDDQIDGSYGKLELTTHYDIQKHALNCIVMRARGLRATDINGLADPYCLLVLEKGSEISEYRLRTSTVQKTVNPEFSETVTFFNVEADDIESKCLHVAVMDDDRFGHEVLGELRLPLCVLKNLYSRHFTLPLEKPTTSISRFVEAGRNRGSILISLVYSRGRESMAVKIIRCRDLPACDSNGYSDPFVKLQLRPDPHQRRFKTSTKWKTLSPEFNEEFSFKTKLTDLPKQRLEVAVWDKDFGKSNDYIGGLILSLSAKGERLRHWLDALKFPDKPHERWHHLCAELVFD